MGQLISASVEFPVSESLFAKPHGHCIWRALDLGGKQLMDALIPRISSGALVPPHDQLLAFCLVKQWQRLNGLIRVLQNSIY